MIVCLDCSKLSKVTWEVESPRSTPRQIKAAKVLMPRISAKKQSLQVAETLELVDNFGSHIRQAREKLGLTHEDLGRKISEKVSVLKKIESGKMTPTHQLAERLEHTLRVRLLVPIAETKIPSGSIPLKHCEVTLGDLIKVKKKMEEKDERKPS